MNANAKTSYSQFGEDCLLTNLLPGSEGFYVDIGAHDPWRYSNTALFFLKGWNGVNVDADIRAIEKFQLTRPNDINLHCGVGPEEGELEFTIFSDGAVNTFDKSMAEKINPIFGSPQKINVKIRKIEDIFSENVPKGKKIDYLNIDCEGLDDKIVLSYDWSFYRPKVITVELNFNPDIISEDLTYKFLRSKNYIMRGNYFATAIFQSIESL